MILRRYGTKLHSVELDFDPRALTEVGFRRDHEVSLDEDELEEGWEKVDERELTAEAEGDVQDEAESRLLEELEARFREIEAGLGDDRILVVENSRNDHPKTRDRKEEVIVGGKNRLYFKWRVDPPLRVGIYQKRSD